MNSDILLFKENFRKFYQEKVSGLLEEAEIQRKLWAFRSLFRTIAFILLIALIIFKNIWIFILLVMVTPFGFATRKTSGNSYTVVNDNTDIALKHQLMPDFLSIFGKFNWESLTSSRRMDITIPQKIGNSNISFANTPYVIDDTIKGIYKDTALGIYEINADNNMATGCFGCLAAIYSFPLTMLIWVPLWFLFSDPFLNMFNNFNASLPEHLHNNLYIILAEFLIIVTVMLLPTAIIVLIVLKKLASKGFRGIFIEFDVKKQFTGETFWVEKTLLPADLQKIDTAKFSKVNLEDVNFNSKFQVYSTNQVEARYMLTTAFIERFQHIETAFKSRFIRGSFKDGKLYILMQCDKDLFAMANKNQKITAQTFETLFNEVVSILSICDTLKLDGKTGL